MATHYHRGTLLYERHQFEHAAKAFCEELAETPNDALAHAMLGLSLCAVDKAEDAKKETSEAISLSPQEPFAHYAHAFVLFHCGKINEAEKFARQAIELDCSSPQYFSLLAEIYLLREQWQRAAETAAEGLKADPEHVTCLNAFARALVRLNRYQEASDAMDAALKVNPESSLSHRTMGWVKINQGDSDKASEHYREALRLEPNSEAAREGVVLALKRRNFLFAPFLDASLAVGKTSSRIRFAVILILMFTPFRALVVLFFLMSYVWYQFFNFLISFDELGKKFLRAQEIYAARSFMIWLAGCIALSCLGAIYLNTQTLSPMIIAGLALGPPLVRVWDLVEYGNRKVAAIMMTLCVGLCLATCILAALGRVEIAAGTAVAGVLLGFFFPTGTIEKRIR